MASIDPSAKTLTRIRRQFQDMAVNGLYTAGSGITWDPDTNTLSLDLAANSGLEFTGVSPDDQLRVIRGTANQVYGMNAAATAPEFKSFATGTSGTDFNIVHTANTVTLNIPSASTTNRGVVTTGSQTFNGDKTFGNAVTIFGVLEPAGNITTSNPFTWSALDSWTFSGVDVFFDAASYNFQLFSLSTVINIDSSGSLFSAYDSQVLTLRGGNNLTGGAGGQGILVGGTATGSNNNGGEATLRGGLPTGTGTSIAKLNVQSNAAVVQERIAADLTGLGFFGATPIAQPGTYTLTAGTPAAATTALNASGNSGAAFTGIATGVGGTPYAQLTDLNTLRAECANLAGVLRQLIKHIGDTSGLGLVNETSY